MGDAIVNRMGTEDTEMVTFAQRCDGRKEGTTRTPGWGQRKVGGAFQADGIASTKALLGVYLMTESPKEPVVDGGQ